ncbi:MAG: SDR family NAD(P)-dependent oxidoreductase [Steroidobacteraceae bacterium]
MALLSGRTAVVTGAGGGLGRAYAHLFAREGANVVVNDHAADLAQQVVEEIHAQRGTAVSCAWDVGAMDSGSRLLATALEHFGRVDILINNAGILRDRSLVKMEEADWDAVQRVNLKGTYLVTRPIFQWMKDNAVKGVIINTTSTSGLIGNFGQSNYAAAKGGVWAFTHVLALEGARYGIRVWNLAPAAVTGLTANLVAPELREELAPEHVAPTVLYMASDLSAPHTGKTLFASGRRIMELKLQAAPGIAGRGVDARQIAASANRIFHSAPDFTLADLEQSPV